MTDRVVLAIDPGVNGAYAIIRRRAPGERAEVVEVGDLPTFTKRSGKTDKTFVNLPVLGHMLNVSRALYGVDTIVIEEVSAMPGQGVTSMFRFGFVSGAIEGVAAALQFPVARLRPQTWMKAIGFRGGDPDATRSLAVNTFPEAVSSLSRKKDHNRADAILIGHAYLTLTP